MIGNSWLLCLVLIYGHAHALTSHTGLKAASADDCCPWCGSTKNQRQDPNQRCLTFETATINMRQLVQVDYTLVDLLHLLLRIMDQVRCRGFPFTYG